MPSYTPEQFAAYLLNVVAQVPKETVAIVRRGSANVKRDARRNVQQTAPIHNAHAFRDINFDVEAAGTKVIGDIGYDDGPGKAGNLGNLLEFGGGGDASPPHRDLARALEDEDGRFVRALEDMGEELLGR